MAENTLKTLHPGSKPGRIKIIDINIPCAVLEDGTRVLSEHGVTTAMKSRSGASKRYKKIEEEKGRAPLPVFMASSNLKPFISDELRDGLMNPIKYRIGKRIAKGYPAELLPQICDVWLLARDEGKLNKQQLRKCKQAEILMRGLAHIGIIALVDEATDFQEIRDRIALEKILDKYLRDQVQKTWTKTFPNKFFKNIFRLKGWQYSPLTVKRPSVIGHYINDIIYSRLAPGVLKRLREKNPPRRKGRRRYKHFQYLTDDYGVPELKEHLSNVNFLMDTHSDWNKFKWALNRAAPKYGDTMPLDFPESD